MVSPVSLPYLPAGHSFISVMSVPVDECVVFFFTWFWTVVSFLASLCTVLIYVGSFHDADIAFSLLLLFVFT